MGSCYLCYLQTQGLVGLQLLDRPTRTLVRLGNDLNLHSVGDEIVLNS